MVPKRKADSPLSASLILRVAEAADGMRDGKPHWFLVAMAEPHDVTPFDSEAAAQAAHRKKKPASDFTVLGPYIAGAPAARRAAKKKAKKLKAIHIFYEGQAKPEEVDLSKVDAIFLSAAALDKFMYPYYSRVRGVRGAMKMRDAHFGDSEDPPPVVYHEPWSTTSP